MLCFALFGQHTTEHVPLQRRASVVTTRDSSFIIYVGYTDEISSLASFHMTHNQIILTRNTIMTMRCVLLSSECKNLYFRNVAAKFRNTVSEVHRYSHVTLTDIYFSTDKPTEPFCVESDLATNTAFGATSRNILRICHPDHINELSGWNIPILPGHFDAVEIRLTDLSGKKLEIADDVVVTVVIVFN
jgi:hypothetical protein